MELLRVEEIYQTQTHYHRDRGFGRHLPRLGHRTPFETHGVLILASPELRQLVVILWRLAIGQQGQLVQAVLHAEVDVGLQKVSICMHP